MCALTMAAALAPSAARAQARENVHAEGDSLVIRLVDVDLRSALQALAPYLNRPLITGAVPSVHVDIETPEPIARSSLPTVLRGLLEAHGLEMASDSSGAFYRIQPRQPTPRPNGSPTSGGAPGREAPELFVIRLRHAKASEVAGVVNALYGRASAIGEIGEAPSTLSRELRQTAAPAVGQPVTTSTSGSISPVGRAATLTGEITIVPDPRANSLLVRATASDFALIQAAVTQLDVRPLQVLIEVLIAEVRRDRGIDVGVETRLPSVSIGHGNTTIQGSTSGIGLGDFALKVMGIGGVDLDATIRAAATRGDATIMSRPILLAANNERAEINVGSQRPFVQVSRVLPTDNTARDQVVQYKDVGTRLSVTPTISADGYVMLQVTQEINAATAEQAFDAPVISTRSVETRLLVRDGQTIVLGGLTDHQREATQSGIPVLSSIPWIGALFGRAGRRNSQTELLVFLTPRLIRDDEGADAITAPLRKRADEVQP